jgi:hypothetical protein
MNILVGFLLFTCVVLPTTACAEIIVASCGPPTGWRVDYGEFTKETERILETGQDSMRGSHPTFIVDLSEGKYLYEITDPIKPDGVSRDLIQKLIPSKVKQYPLIHVSTDQITAVDAFPHGVWFFSLFPELNFILMGRHTHWATGPHAIGATYYSQCTVVRK